MTAPVGTPVKVQCSPEVVNNTTGDWRNFIRFGGIMYFANDGTVGRALSKSDLGPAFAKVKFTVVGKARTPSRLQDGDAAYLRPGTPVYTVKGYQPEFALAACSDDRLVLFLANSNSKAKQGEDLVDLDSKVLYIRINSGQDGGTKSATIKNPEQVEALVNMVLKAPVSQKYDSYKKRSSSITFYLEDGTAASYVYSLESGELDRGIMLPEAFQTVIVQALGGNNS